MLRTVPPTKQFCQLSKDQCGYKFTGMLIVFVKDFQHVYDSILGEVETTNTLMYKLLTVCGNLLSFNKGKAKQVTWIEEARSTPLTAEQKE